MALPHDILTQQLTEQIALEEHLCSLIREQIAGMSPTEFADARGLLEKTGAVLEQHFTPLNQLLDSLERVQEEADTTNGIYTEAANDHERQSVRMSRMLRDDYSALNRITISNSLLHTTALALAAEDIASLALRHLEHLTPLVVQIGALVPSVVARELETEQLVIDPAATEAAKRNIQRAWRKSS